MTHRTNRVLRTAVVCTLIAAGSAQAQWYEGRIGEDPFYLEPFIMTELQSFHIHDFNGSQRQFDKLTTTYGFNMALDLGAEEAWFTMAFKARRSATGSYFSDWGSRFGSEVSYIGAGYGPVDATFGTTWGAGTLFPYHFYGFDEAGNHHSNNLRIDVTVDDWMFAVSQDIEDGSDGIELGVVGSFGDWDIRAGYENDDRDLGLIARYGRGEALGNWDLGVAAHYDFDISSRTIRARTSDMLGLMAGYEVTPDVHIEAHLGFKMYDLELE